MEDGTKQHIITPISGLCNTPSDFTCDDNATLYTAGLRYVNGELKAIQSRESTNSEGYSNMRLVFVHDYSGAKRLIYYNTADNYLYWGNEGSTPSTQISICRGGFEKIAAIGTTLVILYTDDILAYATWNGSGYNVTNQNTLPRYLFYLEKVKGRGWQGVRNTDSENYEETDPGHDGCFRTDNTARNLIQRDDQGSTCLDNFKNLRNKAIANAYKKKHFVFPFFAVAAIKLFDGTYRFVGRPQLMLTFAATPAVIYYYNLCYNEDYDGIDYLRCALVGEWALSFNQTEDLSQMNTNINGINVISSIDIFVTQPIIPDEFYEGDDPYEDEDKKIRKWRSVQSMSEDQKVVFGTADRQGYGAKNQDNSKWGAPIELQWTWSTNPNDNSDQDLWRSTFDPWHLKSASDMRQDVIDSLGQFRKLASIPYKDTNGGKVSIKIEDYIEETTLGTLTNQDLFTFSDKYDDWCKSFPEDIDAVNRRLIKVGGKQGLFSSPHIYESTFIESGSWKSLEFDIQLQTNEGIKHVVESVDYCYIYLDALHMWFYYPDPRAIRLTVWEKGTTNFYIDAILDHDAPIGGAYLFIGYPTEALKTSPLQYNGLKVSSYNNDDKTNVDNRVTQSPADNAFNDATKTYVGQGNIIKLATLTTALTQDAYKVSTVIAFTTQGVWSITCGDDGTFTSVSPAFSREVCVNKNSVVMTDNKVYFASKKGIMCIVATAEEGVAAAAPKFSLEGDAKVVLSIETGGDALRSLPVRTGDGQKEALYDYYEKVNNGGRYVYDYNSQAILMLYPGRKDYFVFDIGSGTLFYSLDAPMVDGKEFVSAVESYPDAYLVFRKQSGSSVTFNSLLSSTPLRQDDTKTYSFRIVSRPMKLGGALFLKSLRRVKKLLAGSSISCNIYIYGTNNLSSQLWSPIKSLGGKPYKFYMYELNGSLAAIDSIAGLMLEVQTRYTDKPH